MKHFAFFFHTKSSESDMYVTPIAYLNSDQAHFRCPIATCVERLPQWKHNLLWCTRRTPMLFRFLVQGLPPHSPRLGRSVSEHMHCLHSKHQLESTAVADFLDVVNQYSASQALTCAGTTWHLVKRQALIQQLWSGP